MKQFDVLVVDDERDFLEPLVERLQLRKLRAVGADSGQAALDYLSNNPVDVAVVDIKMPGMDGIQLLKEIKEHYPLVEVVLLATYANIEAGMEGLELGAFDYLIKPVKLDELMERILEAYDRKLVLQEIAREKKPGDS